jgi:hypothetical protein
MKRLPVLLFLTALLSISFTTADFKSDCLSTHSDIVSYWKFDNNLIDSIRGYNGQGNNSFKVEETSQVGQAAGFDGTQRATVTHKDALNFGSSSFTIQFWFKSDAGDFSGNLVDKSYYKISYIQEDDGIGGIDGTLTVTVNNIPLTAPVSSDWNFVTLVVTGVTNMSLYVNGNLANYTSGNFPRTTSTNPLIIGDGFKGIIDELAMFNSTHIPETIRADYQKGLGKNDYCSQSGLDYSGTESNFTVEGCYSVSPPLPANTCSTNREYFCQNKTDNIGDYILLKTLEDDKGCSRGENYVGGNPCCPRGFVCRTEGTDTNLICRQMNYDCNTVNSAELSESRKEEICMENQCFWMVKDGKGTCVYNPSDYSCSFYNNSANCTADVWNLGKEGVGTEVCGTYRIGTGMKIGYSIPQDSCRCAWDNNECYLAWDTKPDIFGTTKDAFTCLKSFTTGDCIDGSQIVSWISRFNNTEGIFIDIDDYAEIDTISNPANRAKAQQIVNLTGCKNGQVTRNCGDSIVKVPGESIFNITASIAIIALCYLFMLKTGRWKGY